MFIMLYVVAITFAFEKSLMRDHSVVYKSFLTSKCVGETLQYNRNQVKAGMC